MSEVDWSKAPSWATKLMERTTDKGVYIWADSIEYRYTNNSRIHKFSDTTVVFKLVEIRPSKLQEGEYHNEVVKQERYKKADGMDKIDEWARDKTHDQFRTIMWAMCEKYESRLGKKDAIVKEVGKMADYMHRWSLYEQQWANE